MVPLLGLLPSHALAGSEPGAPPEPARLAARWAGRSALTVEKQRFEGALTSNWAWGATDWLELRAHPLAFWLLPQLSAKLRWFDSRSFYVSSTHQVTFPTLLLRALAREGSLGLLPPSTEVRATVQLETQLLATLRLGSDTWATLSGGLEASPPQRELPLLDFPFLYPRYASVQSGWVPRAGLAVESLIARRVGLTLSSDAWWLPVESIPSSWVFEHLLEATWAFSDSHRLGLAVRAAHGHYPVGWRWHWLPSVDYRWAW